MRREKNSVESKKKYIEYNRFHLHYLSNTYIRKYESIAHKVISHGENEMMCINNSQKYQLNNYAVRMESWVMIVGCAITQTHLFYGYLQRHDMRLRRFSHGK